MKLLFQLIVSFGLFAAANGLGATARDLLTSPSQSIRDLGAQILRGSFVAPPRANGDKLVARLQLGMKESAVVTTLRSAGVTVGDAGGTGTWMFRTYRIDDLWVVYCAFTNSVPGKSDGGLCEVKLEERMNNIGVDPPANFTGVWVTYWANGQRSNERHYQYGRLEGVSTSFYPDGSKTVVTPCHNGVPDGEESGFYPSGKIKYKGQYRAGNQIGRWIWYKEDGTVESMKDYS